MKTLVIDTIKNRQWEFEDLSTFDDVRLRKIQKELGEELSNTEWDFKSKTVTLFSRETSEKDSAQKRAELFKEKGVPTHIVIELKFYDQPIMRRDSQLRQDFADIGNGYQTIKIPFEHYKNVMDDLKKTNCKIIGQHYIWETKDSTRN